MSRQLSFETPQALWAAFESYVAYCEDNPILVQERGAKEVLTIAKDRPVTLMGFCVHAGIVRKTLDNLQKQDGFLHTVTRIKTFTRTYCSERAMIGAFDSRFVGGYFATESEEKQDDKEDNSEQHNVTVIVGGEKVNYFTDANSSGDS